MKDKHKFHAYVNTDKDLFEISVKLQKIHLNFELWLAEKALKTLLLGH